MEEHLFLLVLFVAMAILISFVFLQVYLSTLFKKDDSKGVKNATQKRFFFFLLLGACLLILLSVTIPKSPYFRFAKESPSKVIYADAKQYMYELSSKPMDSKNPSGESNVELPVNQLIEFRVTSVDVTHGFGIYNDKAELITQTQAMPSYVNRLRYRFDKPGVYTILCLEFCGAGHPFMRSTFTVK